MSSALVDLWDEQRRAGVDELEAVTAIAGSTGLDRDSLVRQLERSLRTERRNVGRELIDPLRRLERQAASSRHRVRAVPVSPAHLAKGHP